MTSWKMTALSSEEQADSQLRIYEDKQDPTVPLTLHRVMTNLTVAIHLLQIDMLFIAVHFGSQSYKK